MRRSLPIVLLFPLAGCAHHARVAELPPTPVVAVVPPPAPPPLSPINAGLSTPATLWHVRAALNVAALACRGAEGEAITARYNALLAARKADLAAAETALAAEFRAGGGDWRDRYDDAMTRLYNFFSAAPARARFCAAASAVLADAEALPPGAFPGFAAARLPDLDAPFAGPSVPPAPTVTIAAAAPAPATIAFAAVPPRPRPVLLASAAPAPPHLSVDVSALPPD